eukprot:TRINITY_DN36977_c0_g2_i1.p1 TRINITY_DN36977_c0_g2~~TRINITY_DN36977_c0_g2_i1.p1  ORF type:complete len:282 (+),score=34.71 TRINITY_DN36977_c0_g2_i1:88-933(+)
MAAAKRVAKELEDIKTGLGGDGVVVDALEPWKWHVSFPGPANSPYESGTFCAEVVFPEKEYPFKRPKMKLLTKVFHCNWTEAGFESMYITSSMGWAPCLTVSKIIQSYMAMLENPNPNDSSRPEIAQLFKEDRSLHDAVAYSWTRKYAGGTSGVVVVVDDVQHSGGECTIKGKNLSDEVLLTAKSSDRWCDVMAKYHADTGNWLLLTWPDGRGLKIPMPLTCLDPADEEEWCLTKLQLSSPSYELHWILRDEELLADKDLHAIGRLSDSKPNVRLANVTPA